MRNSTQVLDSLRHTADLSHYPALKMWVWFLGALAVGGFIIWGMTIVEHRGIATEQSVNPPVTDFDHGVPQP